MKSKGRSTKSCTVYSVLNVKFKAKIINIRKKRKGRNACRHNGSNSLSKTLLSVAPSKKSTYGKNGRHSVVYPVVLRPFL